MKEINQLYKKQVEHELSTIEDIRTEVLNIDKIEKKVLSFLSDLGRVGEESQCFSFWDSYATIDEDSLKEAYLSGLQMLLSIGFELHIDSIKNYNELQNTIPLTSQFIKVYQNALKINTSYNFEDYQDTVDDYLSLGFKLGIDFEEMINDYKERF